jgi:hypothetical protein
LGLHLLQRLLLLLLLLLLWRRLGSDTHGLGAQK